MQWTADLASIRAERATARFLASAAAVRAARRGRFIVFFPGRAANPFSEEVAVAARLKAIAPLAIVIGVLSFLWCEFSLNFQFHWVTDGSLGAGVGLSIPAHFQLVVWIAFISWGLFFAAGGDNAAFGKILLAAVFGTVAALIT